MTVPHCHDPGMASLSPTLTLLDKPAVAPARAIEMPVGGVGSLLTASLLCRPHNTQAHFARGARKCLTVPRFAAKMRFVVVRVMPPEPPP
jgi:hypothetical protein